MRRSFHANNGFLVLAGMFVCALANAQPAPLAISPNSTFQEGGTQYQPFSMQVTATGGSGYYAWSIPYPEPQGLNLSFSPTTGASTFLGGTPTGSNTDSGFQIIIRLTDTGTDATLDQTYIIPVYPGQPGTTPTGTQPSNTTVYVLNEDGSMVAVTGGSPSAFTGTTECADCFDMARDAAGNFIISAGYQLTRISPAGNALTPIPVPFESSVFYTSVAIDAGGNYIVIDVNNNQILKIYPNAPDTWNTPQVVATFTGGGYSYVRVDSYGNYILAVDNQFQDVGGYSLFIFRITPPASGIADCTPMASVPNGCVAVPITSGEYPAPSSTGGLTFDAAGNYVDVDWDRRIVYTITPAGVATPLFSDPNGYLSDPTGIVRDPLSGYFFLVDDGNNALYSFAPDGSNFTQIASGPLFYAYPGSLVIVDTAPPPPVYQQLSLTTGSLPNGTVGAPYGPLGFGATGGSGNYSWSVSGLPPGLSANTAGVVSGTATAAGTFTVTASVNDATAGMSAQDTFTINIALGPLTLGGPANLGGFAPSAGISATYTASGGKAPYTWSATGLPAGLAVDAASGKLSGAIVQPGNYNFKLQLTDAQPVSTSMNVSVFVLGIATTSLPDSSNNIPYSQTLAAAGGSPPYVWSLTGTLPTGLTLSGSGVLTGTPVLSGTPTATQTFSLGVSVTSGGVTVSKNFSLNVTLLPQPLSIPGAGFNPIALASGPVYVGYSQVLQAAGGIPPYSWSILAGALPDGLSLNASGTISGVPTKVGSFAFTAQATDTSGGRVAAGFAIAINPPALTITTGSPLPDGIVGTAYPVQVLTASGGNGPYSFQAKGSLPSGLTLAGGKISGTPAGTGTAAFTITVTDSSFPTSQTASSEFQISISPPHTDLVLSQTSLSFSFNAGAPSLPSGASSAGVTVASNAQQSLGYSLTFTPAVSWLDVKGGGTTPDDITVSLDPKALTLGAGLSQTSIVVTCTNGPCAGTSHTIHVALNVVSGPPQLSVAPNVLSFSAQTANPQATSQSLVLQNAGGGTLTINSVTAADSFVTFSGVPTSIPASGSVLINVVVNSTGRSTGYYQSTILVNSSAGSANIPVTLLVSQNPIMTLNPAGTQVQMLAGATPGNPNGSFQVSVSSAAAVNWVATVLPGSTWLQLNTASGTSTSANPGTVSFSINPAVASTLAAQPYYGTIQVTSSGVVDSPQNFLVVLNVAAAGSAIQPDPEPAGLVFISNGSSALPPQTVQVFAGSPSAITYSASSDSSWLSVNVGAGTTSAASPASSTVSVNTSGLTPGVYRGGVSYQFTGPDVSSGVRTVNATLIVEGPAAAPLDRTAFRPLQQSAACAPTQLVPTQTGLVNAFAQPAAWPTPLRVLVVDNCGKPVTNGQVVATFSNGDAPLALGAADTTSGNFAGTWTPRNSSSQITISARATASGFTPAIVQIAGQVTPNAVPLLTQNGTLNAFASVLGAAIAPGTIVQIYGSNLAGQTGLASAIPLPTKLNSTQVLIGGLIAPLYFVSSGQINAQVPFELSAGKQYQVIVNANGALSTPNPIQLSANAPGIAGFATGAIIAQHLDGTLVLDTAPAAPGEVIVFYVAGMGLTTQDVASGTASPSTNLAQPLDPPTVTLNNIPVTNILFAGLTPTLVGLYQVDFQVPATAPNGDLQLVLTQATGQSNTTVLPVHN